MKANALARMKIIFTQEIFTEQVVASHAVKVPVTQKLNASIQVSNYNIDGIDGIGPKNNWELGFWD